MKVVGSNLVYWIGVLFTYIFCCKNCSLLEKTKINGKEAGMVYFYKKLSRIVLLFLDICLINALSTLTTTLPTKFKKLKYHSNLSFYHFIYLFITLSIYFLPIHLSLSLSMYLPVHHSIYQSEFLSVNGYSITADAGNGIGLVLFHGEAFSASFSFFFLFKQFQE